MKKKIKGIIFLSIGIYFTVVNLVMSFVFAYFVQLGSYSQVDYWNRWIFSGGLTSIPIAIIGIYLIIVGIPNIKTHLD